MANSVRWRTELNRRGKDNGTSHNNPIENTMTQYAKEEVTKDQLVGELNGVVADTEQLLKSVATAGGEKAGAAGAYLSASLEQGLARTKQRLRGFQLSAAEKTQAVAKTTDNYVHERPWQAIGIAAGISAVAGLVTALWLHRR